MQEAKRYYIASGLANVDKVRELKAILDAAGWAHTYDWTVHGSVQREGLERLGQVAAAEAEGLLRSNVVIVLLPGGRGTHTELGMAVGQEQMLNYINNGDERDRVAGEHRIVVFSENPEVDFSTEAGTTCAFYFHPFVERFSDMPTMIESLIGALS